MINQLLLEVTDLPKLVGKFILSKDYDDHNLINAGNKRFVLEKRLLIVVSSKGKYALAHLHAGYDIKFRAPVDFVEKINSRSDDYRFFSLATPAELKTIHGWLMDDATAL